MTNVTLHGEIAEYVGRENWSLKVNSIKEALRAIQVLSNGKLLKYLIILMKHTQIIIPSK